MSGKNGSPSNNSKRGQKKSEGREEGTGQGDGKSEDPEKNGKKLVRTRKQRRRRAGESVLCFRESCTKEESEEQLEVVIDQKER